MPNDPKGASFEFASKLLHTQHEFARSVIAAASPVLEKTTPAETHKSA